MTSFQTTKNFTANARTTIASCYTSFNTMISVYHFTDKLCLKRINRATRLLKKTFPIIDDDGYFKQTR